MGQQPLSTFWLLRRRFIFREFAYIMALLRGSIFVYILAATEEFIFRELTYLLASLRGSIFVYILAAMEELLSSVNIAYSLASLRGNCL